jgi:hypothetical protein
MMTMMKGWAILALASLWAPTITAQECAKDGVCDTHERCAVWKAEGECYRNKVRRSTSTIAGWIVNKHYIGSTVAYDISLYHHTLF